MSEHTYEILYTGGAFIFGFGIGWLCKTIYMGIPTLLDKTYENDPTPIIDIDKKMEQLKEIGKEM